MKAASLYRLVYRVTDLNDMCYDVVKALLNANDIEYDYFLIETTHGVAYVYQYRHSYRVFYK